MSAPQPLPWPMLLATTLAAVVVVILAILILRRNVPAPDPLTQAARILERFGAKQGVTWQAGSSVREYGELLTQRAALVAEPITTMVRLIEQGRYTGRALSPHDLATLRSVAEQLREATKASER